MLVGIKNPHGQLAVARSGREAEVNPSRRT